MFDRILDFATSERALYIKIAISVVVGNLMGNAIVRAWDHLL